jgi:hypothetical protein
VGVEAILNQKLRVNELVELEMVIELEEGMLTDRLLEPVKLKQSPNLQLDPVCQEGELSSVPTFPLPETSAVVVPFPSSRDQ